MWSILTLISKNFLSFVLSTNKYISIELVQWNTNIKHRDQPKQKSEDWEERNPKRSKKAQKWIFMFFKLRNKHKCRAILTHTHTNVKITGGRVEWCMKNIYLGKEWNKHSSSSSSSSFFVLSACCLFFLNLHSTKSFISNGRRDDPDNIMTFINPNDQICSSSSKTFKKESKNEIKSISHQLHNSQMRPDDYINF